MKNSKLKVSILAVSIGALITFSSCSKEETLEPSNQENVDLSKKAIPQFGIFTFSLSNCPNPDDDCCKSPAADCGEAVDVYPSIKQTLSSLTDDSDGSLGSTNDIIAFLDDNQSALGLSSELTEYLLEQSILNLSKHVNGQSTYFIISNENEETIYVINTI